MTNRALCATGFFIGSANGAKLKTQTTVSVVVSVLRAAGVRSAGTAWALKVVLMAAYLGPIAYSVLYGYKSKVSPSNFKFLLNLSLFLSRITHM